MKTLFTRNGDKLVFDHVSDGEIYGRILLSNGRIFEPQNIDAILARGYWVQEPNVNLMDFLPKEIKSVSLKYSEDQPRDENGRWTDSMSSELSGWDPQNEVPNSPKNAGGMTAKTWWAWERGNDGNQYDGYMRAKACEMLGLQVPADYEESNYYLGRGFGAPNEKMIEGMVNAIANSKEQPELYRGFGNKDPEFHGEKAGMIEVLKSLEAGDKFDMPLASTTRSPGVGLWYADDRNQTEEPPVVMKIQAGANGVAVGEDTSFYPQDKEVVVNGKFEVVNSSVIEMPYWARETLSVVEGKYRGNDGGWHVGTAKPETAAKIPENLAGEIYKTLEENPKADLSKFNTDDMQFTNDRTPITGDPSYWGRSVSVWNRQEPKPFHVIEVKQAEVFKVAKDV